MGWELKWSQKIYGLTKPHYNVHIYKSFTHNTGYLTIHLVFDRCINNRQKEKLYSLIKEANLPWPISLGFSIKGCLNWCRLTKVYGILAKFPITEARHFSFLCLASNLLHGVLAPLVQVQKKEFKKVAGKSNYQLFLRTKT